METWKKNKSNKLQNCLKIKDTEAFSKRKKKGRIDNEADRNLNFFMNGHAVLTVHHISHGELNHIRKFEL